MLPDSKAKFKMIKRLDEITSRQYAGSDNNNNNNNSSSSSNNNNHNNNNNNNNNNIYFYYLKLNAGSNCNRSKSILNL